jgi:hypothetical protein
MWLAVYCGWSYAGNIWACVILGIIVMAPCVPESNGCWVMAVSAACEVHIVLL